MKKDYEGSSTMSKDYKGSTRMSQYHEGPSRMSTDYEGSSRMCKDVRILEGQNSCRIFIQIVPDTYKDARILSFTDP